MNKNSFRDKIFITFLIFQIWGVIFSFFAFAREEADVQPAVEIVNLHTCRDEKMKVEFLCYPDWELKTENDTLLMIISDQPYVTFTIAKSESPVIFLKQLTNSVLQELGQYQDGFKTQVVLLAGEEAIQIMGVSKELLSSGFNDYYLIHDLQLYSFLFSVDPKERWKDYEDLIYRIKESIKFSENN
ncbi:MAG: hypothetical protein H6755_01090 [Candidatus Omnitrophica bacterium]|nr:hypothetical protein [Candidatus Omnitrophota bacterium]MCB9746985.1 hypothetical protein [Candidatus Omnitrophota bacterium]